MTQLPPKPAIVAEFHVRYQISLGVTPRTYLHPWRITNNKGEQATVHYEHEADAWEFAQTLARKTSGVAIRHNKKGDEVEWMSFVPGGSGGKVKRPKGNRPRR